MLRKLLESRIGQPVSTREFAEVMEMTTEDIKFNNICFKKRTRSEEMITIAARCASVLKRYS